MKKTTLILMAIFCVFAFLLIGCINSASKTSNVNEGKNNKLVERKKNKLVERKDTLSLYEINSFLRNTTYIVKTGQILGIPASLDNMYDTPKTHTVSYSDFNYTPTQMYTVDYLSIKIDNQNMMAVVQSNNYYQYHKILSSQFLKVRDDTYSKFYKIAFLKTDKGLIKILMEADSFYDRPIIRLSVNDHDENIEIDDGFFSYFIYRRSVADLEKNEVLIGNIKLSDVFRSY